MLGTAAIGPDKQFLVVREHREAGPDLLPGDHEVVTGNLGPSGQRGQVGSGPRLGEPLAPDVLAAQDAGQVKGLLLLAGAGDQRRSRVVEADEGRVDRGQPGLGVLLVPDQLLQRGEPAAAVLLRPRDPGPAAFPLRALPGEVVFPHAAVPGVRPGFRRSILREPGAHLFTELSLLRREVKIQLRPPSAPITIGHLVYVSRQEKPRPEQGRRRFLHLRPSHSRLVSDS